MDVHFDVREPETHLVAVTIDVPAAPEERIFRMAAWVPGSYKIRDFGRHVQDVEATVAGEPARVEQTTKDSWHVVGSAGKDVQLQYRVYCRELTVDTSHVTSDHAHLFPATLVLYDAHSRSVPHRVRVTGPRGWRTYSGLESKALDGKLLPADDYDHLIDCPIEVAPSESIHVETFTVRGKKHRLVVWMPPDEVKWKRVVKDVRALVDAAAGLFGGLPYEHYTFLTHVAVGHGGGLEHRNSTVLGIDPVQLRNEEKLQTRFYPLVAHEFFHTWNVKRMRPAAFSPYDLQHEVYTELLWLFEGVTSYYELPLLARAGILDDEHWAKVVAEMIKYYEMALGRNRLSVAKASKLTWTLLYQPHEHNVNRNVSYYTKGLFVGLCLDRHLRINGVADGLDDVMRHMHAKAPIVPEDGFAAIVKEATGVDVSRQLRRWVHGTDELPIDASLRDLGWDVKREHSDPKKRLGLGVAFREGSATIERIPQDAPAYRVLQPDDELVAVEGYKWHGERFAELATTRSEGDLVDVAVFREGRLYHRKVPLRVMPFDKVSVAKRKGDAVATRRRRRWLGR